MQNTNNDKLNNNYMKVIPLSIYTDGRNPYSYTNKSIIAEVFRETDAEWETKVFEWMKKAEKEGRLKIDERGIPTFQSAYWPTDDR